MESLHGLPDHFALGGPVGTFIESVFFSTNVFVKWKNRKLGKKPSLTVNPEDFNEFVPVFKKLKKRFL